MVRPGRSSRSLALTDGVHALRFRYNALNNANLWLWGLYGNDRPKGYELLASVGHVPEFGGRFQYPLLNGEFALTAHSREVNGSSLQLADFRENRIALDGRWRKRSGCGLRRFYSSSVPMRCPMNGENSRLSALIIPLASGTPVCRGENISSMYYQRTHLAGMRRVITQRSH